MQLGNHTNHSETEIIMKKQMKPILTLVFYEVRNK